MNPSLETIPGLLDAESPIEWAFDNLRHIRSGEHACVFAYPGDENLVVRVSDYPDGWFAYAAFLADAAEDGLSDGEAFLSHAPDVHVVAVRDGHYFAISGKLDEIEEDSPAAGWIGIAASLLWGKMDIDPRALAEFNEAQPDFARFAARLPSRFRDLRASNWMLRGGALVLNDPAGTMTLEEERQVAFRWSRPAGAPVP